jgi:hypothetical protein
VRTFTAAARTGRPAWLSAPLQRGKEDHLVKRFLIAGASALVALALLAVTSVPGASAHERRTVAGTYNFVVGFLTEPAFLEEPNAVSLTVTNAQTNQPVEGVEKTLKADVTVSGQTRTFDLRTRFGQPGAYIADLIPTKTGTWVFRFHGTINDTRIDERFESGPGRFNDVQAKSEIQFPSTVPSNGELAQQVTGGQPAEAGAGDAELQRALDKADDAQQTAVWFGIAGITVGALGVALAAWALMSRRGTATAPVRQEPV